MDTNIYKYPNNKRAKLAPRSILTTQAESKARYRQEWSMTDACTTVSRNGAECYKKDGHTGEHSGFKGSTGGAHRWGHHRG